MDQVSSLPLGLAGPDTDARLWAAFATAGTMGALCRPWLALQCRTLPGVDSAMLLLATGNSFSPVAMWPDAGQDLAFLHPVAEQCLQTREPVVLRPPHASGATGVHVAYPFLADGDQPAGAVVLDFQARAEPDIRDALRSLHWGVGWLEAQAVRDRMLRERERVASAAAALDLVAVANEHERPDAAAMAVANELAVRLGSVRVAIGLTSGQGARLVALSHTAWFKRRTAMVQAMQHAMDEAMDQRATIRLPATGDVVRIQVAHEALRAQWDEDCACATFPLLTDRGPAGAVTVLFKEPPSDAAIRLGEATGALLGPILDAKRRARRLLSGRIPDALREAAGAVAGPRHLAWKLGAATLAAVCVACVLVPMQFRVSAKAVLEGEVQRAVPAPFEGFIASAPIHAGDLVRSGDLLATLDDKDLQLDRVKWRSEHDRLTLKVREAMSKHDPSAVGQLEAQLRQADAQANLAQAKLDRARITAPIDGIVVSGDLSQSIGAPVETGKVLFEVAPLDTYRVLVHVDEHDIRYVVPGARGQLLLHGLASEAVGFTVRGVSSVADVDGKTNSFRVEGALDAAPAGLRPGMEGIGKVVVDRRSVASVWTRGLLDWLRMQAWSWLP